jgi:hypothetical protein
MPSQSSLGDKTWAGGQSDLSVIYLFYALSAYLIPMLLLQRHYWLLYELVDFI